MIFIKILFLRLHQKEDHGKEMKWCRKCNIFIDPNKVHPNHK